MNDNFSKVEEDSKNGFHDKKEHAKLLHNILVRIQSDINQINAILFLGSKIKVLNFAFFLKGLWLFSFIPQLYDGFPNFELKF